MVRNTSDFFKGKELERKSLLILTTSHFPAAWFPIFRHIQSLAWPVRLALLFLFFRLKTGGSERFKGLLSVTQPATAERDLKPSPVSMCYVFFISHMTSYNIQQPVLKEHSPSTPNFKIKIYLFSFSWKEYMDKNHLQPVCAQSPETGRSESFWNKRSALKVSSPERLLKCFGQMVLSS